MAFTPDDDQVFADFQVADNDEGLKNLISTQRKLNGALCQALWSVLDALQLHVTGKDPAGDGRALDQAIEDARTLTLAVAHVPPGCDPKNPATKPKGPQAPQG